MARTKLPGYQKKEKLNITVTPEIKRMAETLSIKKSISISNLIENCILKEYQKYLESEGLTN